MRKSTLITHLEQEEAVKVKTAADNAGMSTSSYIRKVLVDHLRSK